MNEFITKRAACEAANKAFEAGAESVQELVRSGPAGQLALLAYVWYGLADLIDLGFAAERTDRPPHVRAEAEQELWGHLGYIDQCEPWFWFAVEAAFGLAGELIPETHRGRASQRERVGCFITHSWLLVLRTRAVEIASSVDPSSGSACDQDSGPFVTRDRVAEILRISSDTLRKRIKRKGGKWPQVKRVQRGGMKRAKAGWFLQELRTVGELTPKNIRELEESPGYFP